MKISTLATMAVIAVLPGPLRAQDLSSSGDRPLVNPTYLPLQGELTGASAYAYGSTESTVTNANDRKSFSRSDDDTVSQNLEYGVTNDIEIEAGAAYQWSHALVIPASRPVHDETWSGFRDPTFGVTWRVLDQRRHQPVDFDLSTSFTPNDIDARGATGYPAGTMARGGDALRLQAALGRESRDFTVQAYFAEYHYSASSVSFPQGVSVDSSSFWQPSVGLRAHARLSGRLSVNLDAAYVFASSSNTFNGSTDLASLTHAGATGTVQALLNYHLPPAHLVASLGYVHTFYGTTTVSYPLDLPANYAVNRSSDALIAELRYKLR